ncbi:MAG: HepT-like ribonuclease domain-containing protein, partial [Promethearchaeota archaeon]
MYVNHICEAIKKIESYSAGVKFSDFNLNFMMHDAVIRELQLIGEAVKMLNKGFIEKHSN